jgi:hypothetical protein
MTHGGLRAQYLIPNLSPNANAYPSIRPFRSGHVTMQSREISANSPFAERKQTADRKLFCRIFLKKPSSGRIFFTKLGPQIRLLSVPNFGVNRNTFTRTRGTISPTFPTPNPQIWGRNGGRQAAAAVRAARWSGLGEEEREPWRGYRPTTVVPGGVARQARTHVTSARRASPTWHSYRAAACGAAKASYRATPAGVAKGVIYGAKKNLGG